MGIKRKTVIKGDLPLYDADSYSYGGTFNFDKIIDRAGTFTISNTKDRRVGSDSINYEYGNTLFSGRYGTVGLRAGVQRYHYDNQSSTNEKYINLDFSLPLSTWLSTGFHRPMVISKLIFMRIRTLKIHQLQMQGFLFRS